MVTENNALQRNYGLDNLKLTICLIVVMAHTMLPYTDMSLPWFFFPELPNEVLSTNLLIKTNHQFSMPIFFMIAGYFVPSSYDKQGFGTFLWKKTKRLLIPAFVILTYCFVFIRPIYHVWFLQMLFLFCLTYALFRKLTQWRTPEGSKVPLTFPLLLGISFIVCVLTLILRTRYDVTHFSVLFGIFYFEPARLTQYIMVFIFGIFARRFDWFKFTSLRQLIMLGAFVFVVTTILIVRINEFNYIGSRLYTILESILCICTSLLIIWIYNHFITKTNPLIASLTENSLGIYLFHMPILYYVQTYTKTWEIYFPLKLALIILFAICTSYLLSFLLRKSKFIRQFI
ncbi:MAG: acyltransferase family protein [Paludibacteraceae bacterium]|nr:acyltransferase family protein [Paludibacteraceae bacterium]